MMKFQGMSLVTSIDSDDVLGSNKNKFSGFKFLGSSTTQEEYGTSPDDRAILNKAKDSDKDDTSDAERDLRSPHNGVGDENNDEEGEYSEDESSDEGPKRRNPNVERSYELQKLVTREHM
ncbi:unnamed protein product [Tuber aestivum]|uniref:Uncharacterized protein n=1 Tax=Tuber aestivum TaxID=59557 RepID=A0A292PN27_9PEZI|nr:unnamed protein product [Tuber aestivum]